MGTSLTRVRRFVRRRSGGGAASAPSSFPCEIKRTSVQRVRHAALHCRGGWRGFASGNRWWSGRLGGGELAEFPVAARRGGEQRLGVVVLGRAEHLLGGAVLDDAALAHDRDVVADLRGDAQVVGD